MVITNAKLKIDASKREDYLKLMKELAINFRKGDDSLSYHYYEDITEENVLVVVKNYKDE